MEIGEFFGMGPELSGGKDDILGVLVQQAGAEILGGDVTDYSGLELGL